MNHQTDSQLLRAYADHRAEPAFAELVRRHVDLVHSAALRMVCDAHLAQDVTQGVFVALAKNAAPLADRPVLAGWLHRTARNLAAQTVRTDVRRRAREQEAAAMNELLADQSEAVWEHVAPLLDEALGELAEPDRDAVLLRYFERKSAREMAQTLGVSDEAAQKRVSRAVERLREFFARHGVSVGASGLAVSLTANAVQAAPAGLAVAVSTAAALAGTTLATTATTATATAAKAIAMTTLQKTLVTATVAALAAVGIYQARQAATLRREVQLLRQQGSQFALMATENDRLSNLLAQANSPRSLPNDQFNELMRLRGEVTRLRADAVALTGAPPSSATSQYLQHQQAIKQLPQIANGIRLCAADNNWQYAKNFDELTNLLQRTGRDWLLSTNFATLPENRLGALDFTLFEFVNVEVIQSLGWNAGQQVILKEKAPYQTPDGKWERMYGFADGTSKNVVVDDRDFDSWERTHALGLPRKRQ